MATSLCYAWGSDFLALWRSHAMSSCTNLRSASFRSCVALMLYCRMCLKFGSLVLGYLFGYSMLRFLCEIVREPDIQLGDIGGHFTMG